MSKKNIESISFHPGYYISEIIDDLEITQEEFAIRLGTTAKTISKLVNGEANISKDLAMKLASMLNTSPEVWLNLQKKYDLALIEQSKKEEMAEEVKLIQEVDYSFFVKLGVLPAVRNAADKVSNLCSYLSISRLSILTETDYNLKFRNGIKDPKQKNILSANIWVETATKVGRSYVTKPYNERALSTAVKKIVEMTTSPIEQVLDQIKNLLAECGVALVMLPYLKNSGLHGVVKWLSKEKALVAISDRRKYSDTFWFTLFHELGHVFQKRIKDVSYTWESDTVDESEHEADMFAQERLIPADQYQAFVENGAFSSSAIIAFARRINRDPGIIVGRLQNDRLILHSQNNSLRTKIPEICFAI